MVEVCLSSWLEIILFRCGVLEGALVQVDAFVDPVLDIVSLPRNGVCKCLISVHHVFEEFLGCLLLLLVSPLEIRVVFLCHFVIRHFYIFLGRCRFHLQHLVQCFLFFMSEKHRTEPVR